MSSPIDNNKILNIPSSIEPARTTDFNDLPKEIVDIIFQKAGFSNLKSLSLTCKSFNQLTNDQIRKIIKLHNIAIIYFQNDHLLPLLEKHFNELKSDALDHIKKNPRLKNISEAEINALVQSYQLESWIRLKEVVDVCNILTFWAAVKKKLNEPISSNDKISNIDDLLKLRKEYDNWCHESNEKITSIKSMNLDRSLLTALPESIGLFKGLKTLSIKNSPLKSLPESIGQCTELEKLILPFNKLQSLPESIILCTNLKLLDLTGNSFIERPEILEKLPKDTTVRYAKINSFFIE